MPTAPPPTASAPTASAPTASTPLRLARWEERTRLPIIAAALVPLWLTASDVGVSTLTWAIELVCWAVFAADLAVHLRYRRDYLRTPEGLFDLFIVVATFPWSIVVGGGSARLTSFLRLARVARILAVARRSKIVTHTLQRLGRSFALVCVAVLALSFVVYRTDGPSSKIDSYGDALWFGVVTTTTVGYGDMVPTTVPGRLAAVGLMLVGVALLGTVAASLAALFRVQDTERAPRAPSDPSEDLVALRQEIAALREELQASRAPAPDGAG